MYKHPDEVPLELQALDGACGPISVWLILQRMNINVSPGEIIEACGYTPESGCFTAVLAWALQKFGLNVSFHSDYDPHPHPVEIEVCKTIKTNKALGLESLINTANSSSCVLVCYLAWGGDGHFSPFDGAYKNRVLLPYSSEGSMLKSVFNKRYRTAGFCRQAIIVN